MSNVCISRSFTVALGPWISYLGTKSNSYLETVIRPAAKLHVAVLVVEGEPGDVDLTCGLEDAGGNVGAASHIRHYNIGRERPVKLFIRAEKDNQCISNILWPIRSSIRYLTKSICQRQWSGLGSKVIENESEASTSIW